MIEKKQKEMSSLIKFKISITKYFYKLPCECVALWFALVETIMTFKQRNQPPWGKKVYWTTLSNK